MEATTLCTRPSSHRGGAADPDNRTEQQLATPHGSGPHLRQVSEAKVGAWESGPAARPQPGNNITTVGSERFRSRDSGSAHVPYDSTSGDGCPPLRGNAAEFFAARVFECRGGPCHDDEDDEHDDGTRDDDDDPPGPAPDTTTSSTGRVTAAARERSTADAVPRRGSAGNARQFAVCVFGRGGPCGARAPPPATEMPTPRRRLSAQPQGTGVPHTGSMLQNFRRHPFSRAAEVRATTCTARPWMQAWMPACMLARRLGQR